MAAAKDTSTKDEAVIATAPIMQAGISIASKPGTVDYVSAPHLGGHKLTVKTN